MSKPGGWNEPCGCGSGRTYQLCHGAAAARPAAHDLSLHTHLVNLLNQQRLPEAEAGARTALGTQAGSGILWKILSVALVRQNKEALAALSRAADLLPDDLEAQSNLASALHERGEWAAALPYLQRISAVDPGNSDVLVELADCLRGVGRTPEAVKLYERAGLIDPGSAVVHNNLGNALLELGDPVRAVACFQRTSNLRPMDAAVLTNLSMSLRQAGRSEEARAAARRATALAPQFGAAHREVGLAFAALGQRKIGLDSLRHAQRLNPADPIIHSDIGNVLRDMGNPLEALMFYLRAVELEPEKPEHLCNLGNALFEAQKVDESVLRFRQALALREDYAPAHLGLALAFRQQRRSSEALESCRTALRIAPNLPEALAFLGELEADEGRFEEAERRFRQCLSIRPKFVLATAGLATLGRMTAQEADGLVRILQERPLTLSEEISLRHALGSYFDGCGRYDEAFAEYAQANDLTKRRQPAYEPGKVTRRVDRLIEDFVAFDDPFQLSSAPPPTPIFIIGMPRSGTSLAEQILASHPEIFGAGEIVFWSAACDAWFDSRGRGEPTKPLLERYAADYLIKLQAFRTNARLVVDKMPVNFLYAGLIHAALPHARMIHLKRHPIDTCLSIYFQNFYNIGPYASDLEAMAHYYAQYSRIMEHWRSVLPPTTLLEVPYESLVSDPEPWTRRMLDFVGVPWNSQCLEFHKVERSVITASRWQVRQKIHTQSIERWRRYEKYVAPLRSLLADRDHYSANDDRSGGAAPDQPLAGERSADRG
jgi:tetratricopeptide (TPR) repeat protein